MRAIARRFILRGGLFLVLVAVGCEKGGGAALSRLDVDILAIYPHDSGAWTQGLVHDGSRFYESTGLWGQSTLRRVDPESGEVLDAKALDAEFFAEGIALVGDLIYQVTWKNHQGFIWRKADLSPAGTFSYEGEGWGLTYLKPYLVLSDGSSVLKFVNPADFSIHHLLPVTEGGAPVRGLNELEVVAGEIYANVWPSSDVVIIGAKDGRVTGRFSLAGLIDYMEGAHPDVPNGIAYDSTASRLFVTGKYWSKLFEIRVEGR